MKLVTQAHAWKLNNWTVYADGQAQGVIELLRGQTITGYAWRAWGDRGEDAGFVQTLGTAVDAIHGALERVLGSPADVAAADVAIAHADALLARLGGGS